MFSVSPVLFFAMVLGLSLAKTSLTAAAEMRGGFLSHNRSRRALDLLPRAWKARCARAFAATGLSVVVAHDAGSSCQFQPSHTI